MINHQGFIFQPLASYSLGSADLTFNQLPEDLQLMIAASGDMWRQLDAAVNHAEKVQILDTHPANIN